MKQFVRILIIALLAAFAAGTVAHAAGATVMIVKMSMTGAGGADMGDCDGCGDSDDASPSCDIACMTPLLADVSGIHLVQPPEIERVHDIVTYNTVGRTGPPNPHPPRSFILT